MKRIGPGGAPGVAAAMLSLALAATVDAAPPQPGKDGDIPSPAAKLLEATKNLAKAGGYRTQLEVQGGLSKTPDHAIFQFAVRQSYDGQVHREMLHVPAMKTFKTAKKGVRYFEGYWRSVLADADGKMLNSFFNFPQQVLEQALRHAKTGEWIDAGGVLAPAGEGATATDGAAGGDSSPEVGENDDAKGAGGKTVVVGEGGDAKSTEGARSLPRVMRIEAPTREALQHYIAVENSGCLGGG